MENDRMVDYILPETSDEDVSGASAEAEAEAQRAAAAAAEAGTGGQSAEEESEPDPGGEEESSLSEEEISEQLEAIQQKPETERTEEENKFVTDNTPKTIIDIAKNIAVSQYGVEFGEEAIDNSEDGLSDLLRKVYDTAGDTSVKRTMEKYPELASMYEYLENGGSVENYQSTMNPEYDFSEIKFNAEAPTEQDEQVMNFVIAYDLHHQGHTPEEIDEMIESYGTSGVKAFIASKTLSKLSTSQTVAKQNLFKDQAAQKLENERKFNEYKENYKTFLKKTKAIGPLPIAEKDKDEYHNFLFNPRRDSKFRDIPIAQEITYHALNPESQLYNEKKYRDLREFINYSMFMYDRDPAFIEKVVANRAKTLKAGKPLPGFTATDRMKNAGQQGSGKQGEFEGTPAWT